MSTSLEMPIDASIERAFSAGTPPPHNPPADHRPARSLPIRLWHGLCAILEWLFGLVSLLATLALLAAIPVVNLITLGYLLEASGRVATSGRVHDGFIDIPKFARIGSLVSGTWLCLLFPRLLSSLATDAWLIDPDGFAARGWRIAQIAFTAVVIGHILLAWYSGGRLRHFFWPLLAPFQLAAHLFVARGTRLAGRLRVMKPNPHGIFVIQPLSTWFPPAILLAGIRRGRMFTEARDAVWDFVVSLQIVERFWLGLRGFVGALVWLIVPSLMLMTGTSGGGGVTIVIGYLGALAMAFVLLHLPFLQTRFAVKNRLTAMFELQAVRAEFARAPIAYWFALAITLLFALPLYLLKIEPPPRELWWTLTIFFILFIYPARLLTGWAVGRAMHHDQPRFFLFRWLFGTATIPVILFYIFIVFFTQYTSFLGPASILEQHAFLVPVPFLAL